MYWLTDRDAEMGTQSLALKNETWVIGYYFVLYLNSIYNIHII